ncbi:response regulator transcription factor [bacterium]|jgi:DNA-binding response OmpR family regulator|nr:response regulator transcription factor [Balneola sp.]MBR9917731.1 response regulator transcription factor [bacterium]
MSSTAYPILIVEDDSDLSELIKIQLTDNDYEIEQAFNGRIALNKALGNRYSLIILDVMLPEVDGFEICKSVRKEDRQIPILMLTAKAEEADKIMGLDYGADDYLTKPFSIKELIARVKALLRRASASETEDSSKLDQMDFGDLVIYPKKRSVQLQDELIELTTKEFELLLLFANNPGRAYSRQELLDVVWGYQYSGYSHTVNSHINRLRSKIEKNPSEPKYITTVWGMGYKFAELDELGIQ